MRKCLKKCDDVYDENYENDYLYDTDAYDGIRELLRRTERERHKIAVCAQINRIMSCICYR